MDAHFAVADKKNLYYITSNILT